MQQNNPILYLFIGKALDEIRDGIGRVQQEKLGLPGIAYVTVEEACTDDVLTTLLQEAHSSLMQKQYAYAGELRINYILNAHDNAALSLLKLREKTERFLNFLYPASILADVYALIDDKQAVLTGQPQAIAAVLEMLTTLSDDSSMVYLLSNVSKDIRGSEQQNIIHCIALAAQIKNYASIKPEGVLHNRYHEDYFKKDACKNNGQFMSLGYANIKKPAEIMRRTLLTKLITYHEQTEFANELPLPPKKINQTASMIKALEKENLMGIGINPKQSVKNTTQLQAIALLFNNRLNLYYALNLFTEPCHDNELAELSFSLEELANRADAGFFAAYAISANDGQLLSSLRQLQHETETEGKKIKDGYSQWCNEKIRANLSEAQCFDLAKQYLEWKWNVSRCEEQSDYYRHLEQFITSYHAELKKIKHPIDLLTADNQHAASTLESAGPFQSQSVRFFYEERLTAYLQAYPEEYNCLYGKLYGYLKSESFEPYLQMVKDYIENTLLTAPSFNKPITDETADILCFNQIAEDQVYRYILDWITERKQINIFLKTGEKHLHSEINILLDANSRLHTQLLPAHEHINFFYGNNENEIDILYHTGGFGKEELYYWELYKGFGGN